MDKEYKVLSTPPPKRVRPGSTELIIIGAVKELGDQQAYGAAIQRYLRDTLGFNVSLGQIATTLERLEAKGFLASQYSAPEPIRGGRAKRLFKLEENGARALEKAATSYAILFGQLMEPENGQAKEAFA